MRVLGIDPGYAIVGYGVVDYNSNKFKTVCYGVVRTNQDMPFQKRLQQIYKAVIHIIEKTKPDAISIEQLFYTTNQKTVIYVAEARGVILLAAQEKEIPIYEYTPLQVKQGVTGYGKAEKKQIQEMIKTLLKLDKIPKPDDAADALAVAICHGHSAKSKILNR